MHFTYDALGRVLSYTDKLGQTVLYTYDANGRELTRTNRNGEVVTRTYDVAGRLATVSGPGVDREYRYDALGRVVYQRDGDFAEERSYDLTNLATIATPDATLEMGYDPAGRLVDLVTPGMSATHGYDSRGRLASIVEDHLGAFGFEYDDAGRVSALNRPNGVTTTYGYNAAGQSTSIDSGVHALLTDYDDRALPVAQTDQEGVHGFEHDVLGRLVGVDHPLGGAFGDEVYGYDAADRRTSNGAVYDVADRLLEDDAFTYTYDDEGRRISRTAKDGGALTTYEWNALDQLVALEEGMVRWEFAYDARDLRVRVSNDAGYDHRFVYDDRGTVRAVLNGAGALEASYLTGFGFGEALAEGVGEKYALRDRLGSTVAWVNAAGAVDELVVRDAYGVRAEPTAAVVPFGYTGHAEDPTGLVWGRARVLGPSTGAWISGDPVFAGPRYATCGPCPCWSRIRRA
jgi:YD repeat-containing protein